MSELKKIINGSIHLFLRCMFKALKTCWGNAFTYNFHAFNTSNLLLKQAMNKKNFIRFEKNYSQKTI